MCAIAAVAPALGHAFSSASLRHIDKPVLVIVGDDDSIATPATNARYIAGLIPQARLMALSRVGHYTFLSECTQRGRSVAGILCQDEPGVSRTEVHEKVSSAVLEFLVDVWRRPEPRLMSVMTFPVVFIPPTMNRQP